MRVALVVAVLTATTLVSLLAPTGSVSACSCGLLFPTVADSIGWHDVAFVGRLDSTESVDPAEFADSDEYFDVRYELTVEHAVKGVTIGDRVVMFGNGRGTSCGTSELEGDQELYAILSTEYDGHFVADSTPPCTPLPSIDELFAADLTLPPTSPGPVSLVVVGRLGEAELVSYDADGRPVAYGDLLPRTGQPVVCPGSKRLVQLEQDRSGARTALSIRDLATLEVIDRIDIIVPGGPIGPADDLKWSLIDGAELACRSQDGRDVVGLVPSESNGGRQTVVVGVRPDDAGGIDVTSHGRMSRAQRVPSSDDVVGVKDGALVRFGTDETSEERVIAQLTDGPAEADFDAVFVTPDGADGWWVGLGHGGERATTSRVLVRVGAAGEVERWPVENAPDRASAVVVAGDRLEGAGYFIPIPAPGSSTTGATVSAVVHDEFTYGDDLGDGRRVRSVDDETSPSVELIGTDGATTELSHLLEVRFAVGVPDGPVVDPESIRRDLATQLVASRWITPASERSRHRQPTVAADTGPGTTDAPSTSTTGADEPTSTELPTTSEPTEAGSSTVWLLGVAGAAALAAGVASAALNRHRKRNAG